MEFDAALNPVIHSVVYSEPSYENPVVVSVLDHLWSPLQDIFAHIKIKWYQTVLQSPVKPEFPNSIKQAKIWSLKSCTEGSLHHVRNIPVSGCFSPRQVILEQLAFPASSPPSLGCATSGNQKTFYEKVAAKPLSVFCWSRKQGKSSILKQMVYFCNTMCVNIDAVVVVSILSASKSFSKSTSEL